MTVINRTPRSIKKVYHKPSKSWVIRYYFGSEKIVDENGTRYKVFQQDEYVDIGWIKEPKNAFERQQNKKAKQFLDCAIEDKRSELRHGKLKIVRKKDMKKNMLFDFKNYYSSKYNNENTIATHTSVESKLKKFTNSDYISWNSVDEAFCANFLNYLKTNESSVRGALSQNAINKYLSAFKVFLGDMKRQGKILHFPAENVKSSQVKPKIKTHLTKDEVQALIKTQIFAHSSLKPFFIFSCLTGQAHEECRKLVWNMIEEKDGKYYIKHKRSKTGSEYRISIDSQAIKFIGERPTDGNQNVFPTLKYSASQNKVLNEWTKDAGIEKHITPHVGRHTFAAMFYLKTKDVGRLMNLLDHKDLSTTQRYLASLFGASYFKDEASKLFEFDFL